MKYIDINRKFTAVVNSYMMQGYTFNSSTMGGSQGEIVHIDLTNGTEIIRVLLQKFSGDMVTDGGVELIVGRVTDNVHPNEARERQTIWNDRLEVVSSEKFYTLSGYADDEPFYGTETEAKSATRKRFDRYKIRRAGSCSVDITEKASPAVKKYIRRKFGVTRVMMSLVSVTKCGNKYTVRYGSHSMVLH